jgi:hypothetical protein
MFGDIIGLIALIKELIGLKTENDRNFIDNFVVPAFSLFNKVHDDYLQTFRKYQERIESSNPLKLSLIIKEIERDSLFSQNLRDELSANLSTENDSLSNFVSEIYKYLKYPETMFCQTMQPWSNVRRDSLIEVLHSIDLLTSETIVVSGLLNDIENTILNQRIKLAQTRIDNTPEYLISSLELRLKTSYSEALIANISQQELLRANDKINEIKRYLSVECINFIVKEMQENYRLVANIYRQLKFNI